MDHPVDLLAEYVDGTLANDRRAAVDAHLAVCARCREEVEAAGLAVSALAALPEETVPLGVTGPVLVEAERARPPAHRPAADRFRWAGGLAAAAALLLVAAVLLPQLTGRSADEEGAGGATARAPSAEAEAGDATLGAAAPRLEVLDRDLSDEDLRRLGKETAEAVPATPDPDPAAALESADPAVACLSQSGIAEADRDVLVRVIQASYLGTPAYIGVFHEGPGGGAPPEKVLIGVVSRPGCTFLTAISQRI